MGLTSSRPRRVAFLSEHASPLALLGGADAGGQNVYVDEVSRNLAAHGYQVDVFTRRDDPDLARVVEWADGVRVIHLDAGPDEPIPKDGLWPLMPEFRDGFRAFVRATGARYALLHGNFWMSGWVAADLRDTLGIPAVQIFHAVGITKHRHQGAADTSPLGRIHIEREVIRRVDRLIAQCPEERRELVEDYGADAAKTVVIPSAVNIERFRPVPQSIARQRLGLPTDGLIIGYIGRMLPRKDPRNIVRALALLAAQLAEPVTLLLVGGETRRPDELATPEIGELRRLAAEIGVADRLIFTGKRQPDELRDYYAAVDVAVTTPWYEPFGLTPLEAMACGTPVIGSAVGGITFTIADGETGLLVPPRDPPALAAGLRDLLGNRTRREAMGRAARRRVEREFTWQMVAARTAGLYDTLLADHAMPAAHADLVGQARE